MSIPSLSVFSSLIPLLLVFFVSMYDTCTLHLQCKCFAMANWGGSFLGSSGITIQAMYFLRKKNSLP